MAIGDGVSALASLGVTFGGFSPTVIDGVAASREYVEQLEKADAIRKEAARRKREIEFARTSKPRTFDDGAGCVWTYVVIDDEAIRITDCKTKCASVVIPSEIDGLPVNAIGSDACSKNDYVEEIVCPDGVEAIGYSAFRQCANLRRIVFPKVVGEYSPTWVSHCPKLEAVVLPGNIGTITLSVFDNANLKKLSIGPNVNEIEPGAFQKTKLVELVIDESNPFIMTDGDAVYTKDGRVLLGLARPVSSYAVREGCVAIAKKAFYNIESLTSVDVPEGVTVLGEFAFSHSGLKTFRAPSTLRTLQEKAFYYCKELTSVELNEGLLAIEDSVFQESALEALYIPASIEKIGNSVTEGSNIVHSGPGCTLEIDPAAPSLFIDGEGGLYRREDDGVHMIQLMYREAEDYTAWKGVTVIDDHAFAFHTRIRRVVLPEGVTTVGPSAFRCCDRLVRVELPDSVESIGDDAFLDTSLEAFRVPASLVHLGKNALVTKAARHGSNPPTLTDLEVADGNERFYMSSGMLCERRGETSAVIMFSSNESHVMVPDEVSHIEDHAFNNARGIDYLELRPGLKTIGTGGLSVWCWIEHIHVEVVEPVEGRTSFDFYFPNTSKGIHSISMGIGGSSWVNVPYIMAQCDNAVAHAHDYNSPRNTDSISVYDQTKKMVERLDDPILLTPVNRSLFDRVIRWHITEICVDIARNDDRALLERLLDFGYVNEDNLEEIIGAVNKLQDAAMTGYLLEIKRRRFNRSAFDFDL